MMRTYAIRIVGDVYPMWYSEATSETKAVASIKKSYPELDLEVVPDRNGTEQPGNRADRHNGEIA